MTSSLLLSTIAKIKSTLGVNDLEGDKPVPESIKSSLEGFKNFLTPLIPQELTAIIEKAWDRSNKGKKMNSVSDLCWCLMNSADASLLSERNTSDAPSNDDSNNNENKNSKKPEGGKRPSSVVITRQDVEATSLVQFYKGLLLNNNNENIDGIFKNDQEWSAFLDSLCTPLPMTFRLHQQGSYKSECAKLLLENDEGLKKILEPALGGGKNNTSSAIPAFGCSNATYRNSSREQNISKTGHSGGLWSFQEFVSMLPVASLQIKPHHMVFDMCAAPGSKSLQALDALNGQQQQQKQEQELNQDGSASSSSNFLKNGGGCLVCNEKQAAKARQILPARMKRYGALQNIVLCADASKLPWFVQSHIVSSQQQEPQQQQQDPRFYFDRIICDVPCCGDGTVRKDRSIFGTWNIDYVNQLSDIQLRIARRAAGMLKIGGRMAYSTCSMNPIEDEHVIFHLMCLMNGNKSKGSAQEGKTQIELLDVNEILKNECGVELKSSGGIDLGKFDSASSSSFSWSLEKLLEKIPENFRPSTMDEAKALCSEIAKKVLRVFPHNDNTGGFFVALLQKTDNVPNTLPKANKFQMLSNRKRFELVHPDDQDWKSAMDWFGLEKGVHWSGVIPSSASSTNNNEQTFLSQPHIRLLPASSSPSTSHEEQPLIPFWCVGLNNPQDKRRIHLTTLTAASLVFNSQLAGGSLELVNFGVRLFERMPDNYLNLTVPQRLRIATEGVELVQPTKRVWRLNKEISEENSDFIKNLLYKGYVQMLKNENNINDEERNDDDSSSSVLSLPQELLHENENNNTATSSMTKLKPGSFTFCINFTPTCQVWLAAMLTPLGKIDLLADGSVRRMLLQVFYGVMLESNKVEAGSRRERVASNNNNHDNVNDGGEDCVMMEDDEDL